MTDMKDRKELSNCCKANLKVNEGDGGTSYYICSECNKACDIFTKAENLTIETKLSLKEKLINMREIEFRAWDYIEKKMYYIDLYNYMKLNEYAQDELIPCSIIGQNKLMQYTGRKDSKGNKIYESDIIEWDQGQGTIIFSDWRGGWICKDDRDDFDCPDLYLIHRSSNIEIIGNIIEDQLLLINNVNKNSKKAENK